MVRRLQYFDVVAVCDRLPWVEFVNDALEPYDGEQPGGEPGHPCQEEDGERDQAFPSGRVGQQRLHIDIGGSASLGPTSTDRLQSFWTKSDARKCYRELSITTNWNKAGCAKTTKRFLADQCPKVVLEIRYLNS